MLASWAAAKVQLHAKSFLASIGICFWQHSYPTADVIPTLAVHPLFVQTPGLPALPS